MIDFHQVRTRLTEAYGRNGENTVGEVVVVSTESPLAGSLIIRGEETDSGAVQRVIVPAGLVGEFRVRGYGRFIGDTLSYVYTDPADAGLDVANWVQ